LPLSIDVARTTHLLVAIYGIYLEYLMFGLAVVPERGQEGLVT